jgi:GT2 family glycosyltransferase
VNLSIVIPVYISDPLHLDFTRQTLESIKTKHVYHTYLIVNYCHPKLAKSLQKLVNGNRSLVTNPRGNILASAWNLGLKLSHEAHANYTLLLNNDLVLHPTAIDNLIKFAQKHPEFLLWSAVEHDNLRTLKEATLEGSYSHHPHFSAFMVSQKTIATVGLFDENFRLGYFEDNDFHLRILKAGYQATATTTAKFYHYGSRTAAVDDDLRLQLKPAYQQNRAYFQTKWGIDIHGQAFNPPESILEVTYQTPFNDPEKSIKDW